MTVQRDLFTGAERKDYQDWLAWRASEDGALVRYTVEQIALAEWGRGAKRIGSKWLFEEARRRINMQPDRKRKVSLDNTFAALVCDELIEGHPHLKDLIERRGRKSAALNPVRKAG